MALLHTRCMMLFHLDVFSSQTSRCCTTTWNSCCQMSSFWHRWKSVLLWRPLSSSATSLKTMSDRRLSWRSSWLLWLAYGSPQRCRGMGYFSFCWLFLLQLRAAGVEEVMPCPVRKHTNHRRVVGCLLTSSAMGSDCDNSSAVQKLPTD